ncbi:MAG: hypothetical protein MZW92_47545 [Comamonadaceae bacterium]|nr:hypothetical protein [Comamonadaceae bacterium]
MPERHADRLHRRAAVAPRRANAPCSRGGAGIPTAPVIDASPKCHLPGVCECRQPDLCLPGVVAAGSGCGYGRLVVVRRERRSQSGPGAHAAAGAARGRCAADRAARDEPPGLAAPPGAAAAAGRGRRRMVAVRPDGRGCRAAAVAVARAGRGVYAAWAALFAYIVADDSLELHERGGEWLSMAAALPAFGGLRPQDLGELLVLGTAGVVLVGGRAAGALALRRAGGAAAFAHAARTARAAGAVRRRGRHGAVRDGRRRGCRCRG